MVVGVVGFGCEGVVGGADGLESFVGYGGRDGAGGGRVGVVQPYEGIVFV